MEIPIANHQHIIKNNHLKQIEAKPKNYSDNDKILKAAEEFAQIFYKELLEESIHPLSGAFGGGPYEKQFNDLLLDAYAKLMSQAEKSALTQKLYNDLKNKFGS